VWRQVARSDRPRWCPHALHLQVSRIPEYSSESWLVGASLSALEGFAAVRSADATNGRVCSGDGNENCVAVDADLLLRTAKRTSHQPSATSQSGRKSNGRLLWQPQRLQFRSIACSAMFAVDSLSLTERRNWENGEAGSQTSAGAGVTRWKWSTAAAPPAESPPVRDCSSHICLPHRGCSSAAPPRPYLPRQF
jgi:hypothetical protein